MRTLNILLAEDNQGDILLVRNALEEHRIEHRLHIVRDGGEAIQYVVRLGTPGAEPCPDVMLLDLNLPVADGPEVLRRFRAHPTCSHVPVIVVTSSDAPKDRARVAALGISDYFRKPSDWDEFMKLGAVVLKVVSPA